MNSRDPRDPRFAHHYNDQTFSSEGAGWSSGQPRVTQYQGWCETTPAGVAGGFEHEPRQRSQYQPANPGVTQVMYPTTYDQAGMNPPVSMGVQYQSSGWQSHGWQQDANGHGNPLQTTGGAQTSLGTAAPTMVGVQSSGYNHSLSTNTEQYTGYAQPGFVDDRVECPYQCGTVLTGIHAVGNLTRHLKSKACPNSPRSAMRHICPIYGCGREYARSDGLKVHMRRHHGAPPAAPKYGVPSRADDYDDDDDDDDDDDEEEFYNAGY